MKKVICVSGMLLFIGVLLLLCYLMFFREKETGMPEGTLVKNYMTDRAC